jgi:hypothetical protein
VFKVSRKAWSRAVSRYLGHGTPYSVYVRRDETRSTRAQAHDWINGPLSARLSYYKAYKTTLGLEIKRIGG